MSAPISSAASKPHGIAQRWRRLSPRARTWASLALLIVLWQTIVWALRATDDPALSKKHVTLLNGETTTLAALADGRPLVVNLWATWCPPCRREMPVLAAAQRREPGIGFVFANQAESRAVVERYLNASELTLTHVALDRYAELGRVAGSDVLPATLFYDADGRLIETHLGELSAATLAAKLAVVRRRPGAAVPALQP